MQHAQFPAVDFTQQPAFALLNVEENDRSVQALDDHLYAHPEDAHKLDANGNTLLIAAAILGKARFARVALLRGCSPTKRNAQRKTAKMIAEELGHYDMVEAIEQVRFQMVLAQKQGYATVSASDCCDSTSVASHSPLDYSGPGARAWCVNDNRRADSYLEFTFRQPQTVRAVVTQGRGDGVEWVTWYRVECEEEGHWVPVRDFYGRETWEGNEDNNTKVTRQLHTPVVATAVRIYPVSYQMCKSMRADVLLEVPLRV